MGLRPLQISYNLIHPTLRTSPDNSLPPKKIKRKMCLIFHFEQGSRIRLGKGQRTKHLTRRLGRRLISSSDADISPISPSPLIFHRGWGGEGAGEKVQYLASIFDHSVACVELWFRHKTTYLKTNNILENFSVLDGECVRTQNVHRSF